MFSPPPRIALIGAGGIANVHLAAWLQLGAQVSVYSHAGAEELTQRHGGGTAVATQEEAFDGAEIIDVVTPTDAHAGVVEAAIAAGKHVICEKPVTVGSAETQRLVDAAQAAGVTLLPAHVVRFFPEYSAMQARVAAGGVGEIAVQRFTRLGSRPVQPWFADEQRSGGIVMDQMIHDLDFARWTAGEVATVFTRRNTAGASAQTPGVTSAQVVLTHTSGALSYVSGTWAAPGTAFRTSFEIAGTNGLIRHNSGEHAALNFNGGDASEGRGLLPGASFADNPFLLELTEFLGALRGTTTSRVTAQDGLEAIRIAEAANSSLQSGDVVQLASVPVS